MNSTPKHPNALIKETSPYLLQHAHNPVQWHPWGREAFAMAQRENKPIFLSVGYATCYWCHVMERQSFENESTAAVMNEHFVNIKVDREERPDVDDLYMTAVQLMTGRGGWPMNVFLTPPGAGGVDDPGLKPLYAGTYFPPQPGQGMPSFTQILEAIAKAWANQRDDVLEQAEKVARTVRAVVAAPVVEENISTTTVQEAANGLLANYDQEHGGFGSAPKFPQACNLLFLLHVLRHNPNAQLAEILVHTLDRMARGGMYDQVAGGFHRYSTDERWLVPHFEKMLYDQGQLLEVYADAHELVQSGAITIEGDPQCFASVVRQTCDYLLREMTDASGAFWSAQDAEVDAREGGSYLWTPDEIKQVLGDGPQTELVLRFYGLDAQANFQDPHHEDVPASWVLHQPMRLNEFAQLEGVSVNDWRATMQQVNAKLLAVRRRRKQPITDDKVLTGWNALAIRGLALTGKVLNEPRYITAAEKACTAILRQLRDQHGDLLRSMRAGQAKTPGFLEDWAGMIEALAMLHQVTGHESWLNQAEQLMDRGRRLFANDRGGCFDTLADQTDLFVRLRSTYDGAIPCGNSMMIHALLDLHDVTGKERYLSLAVADLRFFSGLLSKRGSTMMHMQHALLRALEADSKRFAPGNQQAAVESVAQTAKDDRPIRLHCEPAEVDLSSGSGELMLTVELAEGHHVNAHDTEQAGLIPTAVLLLDDDDWSMQVQYPQALVKHFAMADQPIKVYEGQVTIKVKLERRYLNTPQSEWPRLRLRVQLCTQSECLPPATMPVPVRFKG